MSVQADLFEPPASAAACWVVEDEHDGQLGWEERLLSDMREAGSVVACFPGFTGAICERLVTKGLATRAGAGFMDPLACVSADIQATSKFKAHVRAYWKDPSPQFRYVAARAPETLITEGGEA